MTELKVSGSATRPGRSASLSGPCPHGSRLHGHARHGVRRNPVAERHDGLHAQEAPQNWVPAALRLPADMEVISDRVIGSSLRMFSFSTAEDPEALLAGWEAALRQAGYKIDQAQDETLDRTIEFSGEGIGNAKIVIDPTSDGKTVVIEFDATLQ